MKKYFMGFSTWGRSFGYTRLLPCCWTELIFTSLLTWRAKFELGHVSCSGCGSAGKWEMLGWPEGCHRAFSTGTCWGGVASFPVMTSAVMFVGGWVIRAGVYWLSLPKEPGLKLPAYFIPSPDIRPQFSSARNRKGRMNSGYSTYCLNVGNTCPGVPMVSIFLFSCWTPLSPVL
jgi:hypothetical protein